MADQPEGSISTSTLERAASGHRPVDLPAVRAFLAALAALLIGYMFLGRGFAHVGIPPVYVGEVVLALGLVTSAIVIVRAPRRFTPPIIVWLLLAFMILGAARTIPYVGRDGVNALRDAVLWGYGLFALIIVLLADRAVVLGTMRLYGWVVPCFALWLPIAWALFGIMSQDIDPTRPGSVIPLVFFKSGDMAVHIVGSLTFLVIGTGATAIMRTFAWRAAVAVPLIWTVFVTWTSNRGAMVATAVGIAVAGVATARTLRRWMPVVVAGAVATLLFVMPSVPIGIGQPPATPSAVVAPTSGASARPTPSPRSPSPSPTARPSPSPTDQPDDAVGRQVGIGQLIDNVTSIFGFSLDAGLTGTRAARLAWWGKIVDYTVFGPYFWTGKGFGVNLATDDGFQSTADESLRAPHNSHLTVLARMGVPGFALWVVLQGAFGIGLVRAVLRHRRSGRTGIAVVGAWILVYWAAMMANSSFDPYLEGPQGGIWFWSLFGLGVVVMRLSPERIET